jgi:uncharacterized membrane protein
MRRHAWTGWIAATIVVAAIVPVGTVHELPHLIMARTLARIGPPNTMHFGSRPDAATRTVVRPSPDLLYSACPFDLSKGPLQVTARVPHSTYWSVAAFDAATNNFFVRDDEQISGSSIEIIALRPDMTPPPGGFPRRIILFAPTEKGLFLFRLLINDDKNLANLTAIQHQASCQTVTSTGN